MTVHDLTMTKIRQLPEPLIEEVSDFVDFLLLRQDTVVLQILHVEPVLPCSRSNRRHIWGFDT